MNMAIHYADPYKGFVHSSRAANTGGVQFRVYILTYVNVITAHFVFDSARQTNAPFMRTFGK